MLKILLFIVLVPLSVGICSAQSNDESEVLNSTVKALDSLSRHDPAAARFQTSWAFYYLSQLNQKRLDGIFPSKLSNYTRSKTRQTFSQSREAEFTNSESTSVVAFRVKIGEALVVRRGYQCSQRFNKEAQIKIGERGAFLHTKKATELRLEAPPRKEPPFDKLLVVCAGEGAVLFEFPSANYEKLSAVFQNFPYDLVQGYIRSDFPTSSSLETPTRAELEALLQEKKYSEALSRFRALSRKVDLAYNEELDRLLPSFPPYFNVRSEATIFPERRALKHLESGLEVELSINSVSSDLCGPPRFDGTDEKRGRKQVGDLTFIESSLSESEGTRQVSSTVCLEGANLIFSASNLNAELTFAKWQMVMESLSLSFKNERFNALKLEQFLCKSRGGRC